MSGPGVFVTVNVRADTPMDLNVGEDTAVLTLGEAESVSLEFHSVEALEQLQKHVNSGLVTMHAQRPADPDKVNESTVGGAG